MVTRGPFRTPSYDILWWWVTYIPRIKNSAKTSTRAQMMYDDYNNKHDEFSKNLKPQI